MDSRHTQYETKGKRLLPVRRLYGLLAPRAYSVLMFAALFCTLAVKFFHSWRYNLTGEYFSWILSDISVLLGIEVILALICFRWPRKWIIRTATAIASVVCTWSVMNAGWLIRTGTQILPTELLPLIRDPLNIMGIVLVNLIRMPRTSVILLAPSALALVFFFCVLAKPMLPNYNTRHFLGKVVVSVIIVGLAVTAHAAVVNLGSTQVISAGLRYNCQSRAVLSFILPEFRHLAKDDFANAKREIPTLEQVDISLKTQPLKYNVVIVILEGVQYSYTSLDDNPGAFPAIAAVNVGPQGNLTTYLSALAKQGLTFTNTRSTVTHTTKALFALLTGRLPSASQDIAETIPATKPYASIATILKSHLNFRTAFFQSAKGTFESRPGLVHNLGFDKFCAREDLNDPNGFIGYLGCDEFSMLKPIVEWIQADRRPFLLTVLCSVTHDPYEVPRWFGEPAKEPIDRYRQAISYTDKFLAAFDIELATLNLTDKTILCVVGDHGEAFGEHGLLGHERIGFEEVLRIPLCLRAPYLVEPARRITRPVGSVDLTPTLLGLLGFDTEAAGFDGVDVLGPVPSDRKVFFSGWMQQGPAGFIQRDRKFVYDPTDNTASLYDLGVDPRESFRVELPENQARRISDEIINWRKNTIFRLDQKKTGQKVLFGSWLCKWNGRVSSVKYVDSD